MPVPEFESPRLIFISEADRPGLSEMIVDRLVKEKLKSHLKIAFSGSDPVFQALKSKASGETKIQLVHAGSKPYTWQQDRFEFFSAPDGVKARFVQSYEPEMQDRPRLQKIFSDAGVTTGPVIKSYGGFKGSAGGNIESLPGGVLILGSSDFPNVSSTMNFVRDLGGSWGKTVVADTSWMRLGHIDEIARPLALVSHIVLLVGSPKLAVQLLNQSPDEEFYSGELSPSSDESFLRDLCVETAAKKIRAVVDSSVCRGIKNKEVLSKWLGRGTQRKINRLIDEKFDRFADEIVALEKKRARALRVKIIRIPTLYKAELKDGILRRASGGAVLPSFSNGVVIEKLYLHAQTHNAAFDRYFETEIEKVGYRSVQMPLDLFFNYGEPATGYLHCAVQTLRSCHSDVR